MSEIQDNPFSDMLNTMRQDADDRTVAPWIIGSINTVSPLTLIVNGQVVQTGIRVNTLLLGRNSTVNLTGLRGGLTGTPESIAVSSGNLSGAANLGGILSTGDEVVLLQSGNGQYVVLCKVGSG